MRDLAAPAHALPCSPTRSTPVSNFKTLAKFVDKVLKGASASTLPIEQASRIPPAILLRADRVIE
jgi:hypothetical protein